MGGKLSSSFEFFNSKFEFGVKFLGRALANVRQLRGIAAAENLKAVAEDTGLHYMGTIPKDPFDLFKNWHGQQTQNNLSANALCLSTCSKSGYVTSRTLILRRLDDDGFVIMTDNRSKKSRQLEENPNVAMNFLWIKEDPNGLLLSRQVRAEGSIKQLVEDEWIDIYEREPLFCKIRALVCHQGTKIEWQDLKDSHDNTLKKWQHGELVMEKPNHVVAYKMFPTMMEFYEAYGSKIADRVMFLKQGEDWISNRIAA
ncbi:unnamed protein product [Nezara viridula]|uniref:pyridoxal 5'-phosphate synthase n=1 Tax=Nezara viridula TaxID=85310 RepID=A0A9P0HH10_NEZVI|nr:unnamed protein product [Nezara viridula]